MEGGKMLSEVHAYLTDLGELRDQVESLLEGLPQEALDWRPIEGAGELATNSLTAMVVHLVGSEAHWMKEVIAGKKIVRDRDAEFVTKGLNVSELQAQIGAAGKVTMEILSALTEKQLEESREWRERSVSVRWCILHVIEHYAQHLGHMQLTRQLWLAKFKK
jgi:uncharacterized damage-inducible protein DinB